MYISLILFLHSPFTLGTSIAETLHHYLVTIHVPFELHPEFYSINRTLLDCSSGNGIRLATKSYTGPNIKRLTATFTVNSPRAQGIFQRGDDCLDQNLSHPSHQSVWSAPIARRQLPELRRLPFSPTRCERWPQGTSPHLAMKVQMMNIIIRPDLHPDAHPAITRDDIGWLGDPLWYHCRYPSAVCGGGESDRDFCEKPQGKRLG